MTEVAQAPIDALLALLSSRRYPHANERLLQAGIEAVLQKAGVDFRREPILSRTDRPDFLVSPGIAIEIKVDGGLSAVIRQLHRYAQLPEVSAIVLVTTRMQHRPLPAELNGKPVHLVHLIGSVL